jgi:hypothetical protein
MVALADVKKHVDDDDLQQIACDVCGLPAPQRTSEHIHEAGYGFGV